MMELALAMANLKKMYIVAARRLYERDIQLQERILISDLAKKLDWPIEDVEAIWDEDLAP